MCSYSKLIILITIFGIVYDCLRDSRFVDEILKYISLNTKSFFGAILSRVILKFKKMLSLAVIGYINWSYYSIKVYLFTLKKRTKYNNDRDFY